MHGVKRKQWTQELLKQKKIQDKKKIATYRNLVKKVFDMRDEKVYTQDSLKETSHLLQINPEFNAVWNYRRDIIAHLKEGLDSQFWNSELAFTLSQLKYFPKVYWIWNHRVWLLENHVDPSEKKWEDELHMVNKVLTMDARNFHGWLYRRMIVRNIEKMTGVSRSDKELAYTTENINKNISNFSAWHQRAVLLPKMLSQDSSENTANFLREEFSYITNAMFTDAEDQSVWFYIKWFINNPIIYNTLEHKECIALLQDLQKNIVIINQDDLEFSGKQNNWCLKILIVLEDLLKRLGVTAESHKKEYLNQLIEADPLRKRRYLYLLNTSQ